MAPITNVTRGTVRLHTWRHAKSLIGKWLKHVLLLCPFALCLWTGVSTAWAGDPPAQRDIAGQELAARLAAEAQADKAEAISWADKHGFPIRYDDGRLVCEIMAVRDGRPVYYMTENVNAAISIATDRIRGVSFWQLDGSGVTVGLWDEAGVRATHQEFQKPGGGSRVQLGNTLVQSEHTTHVAGTMAAQGIDPAARGMAPAAKIMSFNWNSDAAQMAATTAYTQGQPDGVYVSNHSYGYMGGWVYGSSGAGRVGWHWTAEWAGAQSRDSWFGYYHYIAGQWDEVAYTKNYYLAFASGGNDRTDNPPLGATVYYYDTNAGWRSIVYDLTTCAPGDGFYGDGYDTLCGPAVAKNIMTVGAVGDAVANGTRSIADANMAVFSSWGPTNDGRIKPDIVANGVNVYSTDSNDDSSYAIHSGTSMASPTATGSAALLVQLYHQLFPGESMRASTLKGLIIHTADDLGRPGPDYQFGWGLMNVRAAADLIQKQHDSASVGDTLFEGRLTYNGLITNNPEDTYSFYADGTEPIRVTLCWTDPAGSRLIHDLDLRVIGPDRSTTYYPYVLDPAEPSAIAATGDNHIDNVEQVYIGAVPEPGTHTIRINYKNTLAKAEQYYSLISSMPLSSQFPPTAKDAKTWTLTNTEIIITLSATDDGLPAPPPKSTSGLTYRITTLPKRGSLRYPYGSPITQPTTLVNKGNRVAYTPNPGFTGEDSFSFHADDGGVAPSGGVSNMAMVTVSVGDFTTAQRQVSTGNDDGYIPLAGGIQDLYGKWLLFGPYRIAMRFQSVSVPPGSRIVGAYVELCKEDARVSDRFEGILSAQDTGNAGSFVPDGVYLGTLSKTASSFPWTWELGMPSPRVENVETDPDPDKWYGVYWYQSPNISEVVQEIIDRSDWSAGNSLVILYEGKIDSSSNLRVYSCNGGFGPKLTIIYAPMSADQPTSPLQPGVSPPTALDAWTYACANMAMPVELEATDDALPGPLSFAILSLPSYGSLRYPNGTPITQPKVLAGYAGRVVYVPQAGFVGDDTFTFCADDGGTSPSGGASNTATVTLMVRNMVTREYQVIADEDDAYGADGDPVVFSETLTIGQYDSAMRFRNVDIPQDSEIISSRLKLCPNIGASAMVVRGLLYAEAAGDANDFSRPGLRLRELPRTQESVPWLCLVSNNWPRGTFCSSPDVGNVLQEIVSQDDWDSGNSLAILYAGNGDSGQNLRFFGCSVPYSNQAAKLEITCVLKTTGEVGPPLVGQPPKAEDIYSETFMSESVTILLEATDDGRPNPPGSVTYNIASLPTHGTIEIPGCGEIAEPRSLPESTNTLIYHPQPAFSGRDTFTFYADDGGTPPIGGPSNVATVTMMVRPPVTRTVTKESQVAAAEDDGYSKSNLASNVLSGRLLVGECTSAIRFKAVNIPQGHKILEAHLHLVLDTITCRSELDGIIQAEATGDSAELSGDDRHICQLARTKACKEWFWEAWNGIHPSSYQRNWYSSPNIAQIIQEVADRPDWSPGNAITIIFSDRAIPGAGDWQFYSYDTRGPYAPSVVTPMLDITYGE